MRKTWLLALPLLFLLAACGSTSSGAPPAHHHTRKLAAHSGGAASGTATVATRTVMVGGTSVDALTTPSGMTLYYFTPDSATKVTCSGACAQVWPPLLLGSGQPVPPSGLGGTLAAVHGQNGLQVMYNGHPLYTFSGDKGPGQANGQGLEGKWYVATVGMAANGGQSSSGSSSSGY